MKMIFMLYVASAELLHLSPYSKYIFFEEENGNRA